MMIRTNTLPGKQHALPILVVLLALVALSLSQGRFYAPGSLFPTQPQRLDDFGKLPLSFESNIGQTDPSVSFLAHTSGGVLYFTPSEVVLSLNDGTTPDNIVRDTVGFGPKPFAPGSESTPNIVRLSFIGANSAPRISSSALLEGKVNYLLGDDATQWHTNLPTYGSITYNGLYPGVDLSYTGTHNQLKGTYTISPGADPSAIRWRYANADAVSLDAAGNLQVHTKAINDGSTAATVAEQAPVVWQEIGGERIDVSAGYLVSEDGIISLKLGNYDKSYPLTIDPTFIYSTYLGGSGTDRVVSIAVDSTGNAYVTGDTASTNFPLANPYQPTNHGATDVFITKLNAAGSALAYSTYLGGTSSDFAESIKVDGPGNVYVVGYTSSANFPMMNPYQPSYGGGGTDAFITKLNATGSALVYSTFLGGSGLDYCDDIVLDAAGNAYLSGETSSTNFPLMNPYQSFLRGFADAFVSKLNAAGSALVFSTYLGGSGGEGGYGIGADSAGNVYVEGATTSSDFPTQNPIQPNFAGGPYDAFVTKLNAAGSGLVYSTYLGGSNSDVGRALALDGAGNVYFNGYTNSTNFPTANPIQSTNHGGYDMFVTKVNAAGSGLVYSTYLGGSGDEGGSTLFGIDINGQGAAYVAGETRSTDFPTSSPIQPTNAGGLDAFVTKINAAGSAWVYSTYLGGAGDDSGYDIAVDGTGNAYVSGYTESLNFPTVNPFQPASGGGRDAFIAKIFDPPPTPTATSTSTPTITPTATPTLCPITFTDVHPTDYFYTPVRYLYCHNVISGYGDNTFRPYNNTTRGQLTKIVVLGYGLPIYTPSTPTFRDVPSNYAFYQYIETAYRAGLVSGYNCGTNCLEFRPGTEVTRGQLCKIVVIAAQWSLRNPPIPTFRDVPTDHPFYPFIETAYCHGIISGYTCGTGCLEFRPSNSATRGQICKIVYESLVGGHACP